MTKPINESPASVVGRNSLTMTSCLALTIVGLALVSNRLLDMAAFANEPGFSIHERKEKAHHNDMNYKQTSEHPEINPISWFAREKYDCENDPVIEEAKNQIACSKIFGCGAYGFANLSEVVSAGPSGIDARSNAFRERENKNAIARMTNPTEADLRFSARLVANVADDHRKILLTFPGLFKSVRSVATDFNPNISKFTCRMEFQYDPSIVLPWWRMKFRLDLMRDENVVFVAGEKSKTDPNSDYISSLTEAALRANGIQEKAQRPTTSVATFTVQPSNSKPFVMELTSFAFPGE